MEQLEEAVWACMDCADLDELEDEGNREKSNPTIAHQRGDQNANMHCGRGHKFKLREAHEDKYGAWCPKCGNPVHSYLKKDCPICEWF